jgi:hypothetical protein
VYKPGKYTKREFGTTATGLDAMYGGIQQFINDPG